jgi:uncharacterized protein (TIGR02453 family)
MKYFSKRSMDFITRAQRQKKPEWLDRNREEYQDVLVEPMRELMTAVARELRQAAPGYRFPKVFARIRRSSDRAKTQGTYKNYIGAGISRDSGSMYEDLPSLYLHISPENGNSFSAGGLYMPSARQTKQIRAWIDHDSSLLEDLLADRQFKKRFKDGLGNERMLKTKPRDYPIDHPKIDLLKLSGWYVWRPFTKKEIFSPKFADHLIADWTQVLRLNTVLDHYTNSWPNRDRAERLKTVEAPQFQW